MGGGFSSFNTPLFPLFFCSFIRKQGQRWKHTLNKLLLRILHSLQRLLRQLQENGSLPQFCTDENKQVFCRRRQKMQNECQLAIRLRPGMQRMEAVTQNKWEISQLHTHARLCLDSLKLIFCFLYVFFSFSGKIWAFQRRWGCNNCSQADLKFQCEREAVCYRGCSGLQRHDGETLRHQLGASGGKQGSKRLGAPVGFNHSWRRCSQITVCNPSDR